MMTTEVIGVCFPSFSDFVKNDSENSFPVYIMTAILETLVAPCRPGPSQSHVGTNFLAKLFHL